MRLRQTDYEQVSHRGELVELQLRIALLRRAIDTPQPEDVPCPSLLSDSQSSDAYLSDSWPADSPPVASPPAPPAAPAPWWRRWMPSAG